MSRFAKSLGCAVILAMGSLLIPASVSPNGTVEVAGLCASGDCKPYTGGFCWDGELHWNKKNVAS